MRVGGLLPAVREHFKCYLVTRVKITLII
ncbi:hypothetical protein KL86DES1_21043 [uncultured Desulfovibrio sp.]|uniref:Uncharacterized protein n=1 Tax=uncultured Desulfovibrio sp. TaxID=167968 RepID=A0A212L6K4_9BACT|nr:hypothetical protein KL86DES1_21043 [uncultured Desulfovibrio sp.]VZH33942.1 conserved protein of unknown function [Desulfovibrio sp. 86]